MSIFLSGFVFLSHNSLQVNRISTMNDLVLTVDASKRRSTMGGTETSLFMERIMPIVTSGCLMTNDGLCLEISFSLSLSQDLPLCLGADLDTSKLQYWCVSSCRGHFTWWHGLTVLFLS